LLARRKDSGFRWHGPQVSKRLPYAQKLYQGTWDVPYVSDPFEPRNVENGFNKRVANVTVLEELSTSMSNDLGTYWNYLKELKQFVHQFIISHFQPIEFCDNDESFDSWLNSCEHYNEQRKNQLRKAYIKYRERGLYDRDYTCKSFIKREFYEEFKYPRLINSRSDLFKVSVGPIIKRIEDVVYQLPYFVKGKIVTDLAPQLLKLSKYPYILETDYSAFEGSFSPEYTDCVEEQLFKYMCSLNPSILKIIDRVYHRNGRPARQRMVSKNYEAFVVGSRMSGEMWTSLANGFSNLMNMLFLMKKYNIEGEGYVEGDDGIFGLSKQTINERDFRMLGFRIKMNYGHDISHTSFCGNVFDPIDQHVIVSPENIARLQWSCNSEYLSSRDSIKMALLRAKAMSLYCIAKHTPIAGLLAYKVLKMIGIDGNIIIPSGRRYWRMEVLKHFDKGNFICPSVTDNARFLYASKFNVSLACQLECERIIDAANSLQELLLPYVFLNRDLDYLYY